MIGENIKECRKHRGWTQDQLAQKTGISTISIGNYERGYRCPNLETVQKIADVLEIPVSYLINSNSKLIREESNNYHGDGLLSYLEHLGYEIRPLKENSKRGYCMAKELENTFLDFETLDRVEAMIEADIKKLLFSFGVNPKNNREE